MKTASTVIVVFLILIAAASWSMAEEKPAPTQAEMVTLKIRVLEANFGEIPRELASPLIMTATGREVRFQSGGKVKSKFDDETHDIGTRVVAKIDALGENKYRLKFEASLGNATLPEQEPETECFVQQKLTARIIVESGKMKRLPVSSHCWYEVTVGDPKLMHLDRGNGLDPQPTTEPSTSGR
ncbi:hypothetical protein C5Y96_21580 [Blastopirellula marina]|uniref:Uncharacterized protein n=1 Tax=Blastopirellula marina TaxID=124 RepID=A0A2S8F1I7_9BACT|nr:MULTISPECIES: hypothetical protein [Pirellulaceae]PQO26045.1 hypothetical protein C5Y96_21580 [Blastopirellula marina]RCS44403.1 hypothetical protein DTL36_21625 [Bremerella cremea]